MHPASLVTVAVLGASAAAQDGAAKLHFERGVVSGYFARPEIPDQYRPTFEKVLRAASRLADDPEARDSVRKAFEARWVTGSGNPKLRLDRFDEVAAQCSPFGPGSSSLVDMLARRDPPAAWGEVEFRRWLRGKLGTIPGGGAVDRLLEAGVPDDPAGRADRYAFLLDVVRDDQVATVRNRFNAAWWPKVEPASMLALIRRLEALSAKEGFARLREGAPPDGARIRRLLADTLCASGPGRWPEAGGALAELAEASSGGPGAFLQRAVVALKALPETRTPAHADVVRRLIKCDAVVPRPALGALDPGRDLAWFLWTHRQGVVPDLLDKDRTGSLQADCFRILLKFDRGDGFPSVFPDVVADYDRRMPERTFEAILSPRVVDPSSAWRVIEAVRAGEFSRHRARLGREVLRKGPGTDAAWPGDGAPSRLEIAIELYVRALDPRPANVATLQRHVGDAGEGVVADDPALLGEILVKVMAALRDPFVESDPVLERLGALVKHLAECRELGADLTRSRPLADLDRAVADDLEPSIVLLATGADRKDVVDRFVDRLKLALRVRGLVQGLGLKPPWLDQAVDSLKRHVFKLDEGSARTAPPWDDATLGTRARRLALIDAPLRDCLTTPDDRDRVFRGLYLPLARVPGFLKALRSGRPDWPYAAWTLTAGGIDERRARFVQVFDALRSVGRVDAEDAVLELAQGHLATLRVGCTAWEAEPDEVFAGRWGPNADARVWRRMLAAELPREGGAWRVQSIAARVVEELTAGPRGRAVGAAAPSEEEIAWAANLVTAAEWQDHRLHGADGRILGPTGRLTPGQSAAAPFAFRLIGGERDRQVDGRLRLRLLLPLVERAAGDASPNGVVRLIRLAEIAALLPNDAENNQRPPGFLAETQELRQRVYAELYRALRGEGRAPARTQLLRQMMRLNVANRRGVPLRPAYPGVVLELRAGRSALRTPGRPRRAQRRSGRRRPRSPSARPPPPRRKKRAVRRNRPRRRRRSTRRRRARAGGRAARGTGGRAGTGCRRFPRQARRA